VNLEPVTRLVSQLTPTAPVFSVSGNHDVWYYNFDKYQNLLKKLGVTILENNKVTLQRGKSVINLYGIGDPYTWNDKSAEEYLKDAISGLKPSTGYNILLFHRANMFDEIKGKGFQLVFSGHMHGGQLQIPFRGGLISPQQNHRWFPEYTDGRWTEAGTTMLVSRGLGNNAPVPRLLNPPEIVVATLRSK
jgi:predicted MPP superfamily phosphohydrolase